ncbi:MAG: hypothetical protein HY825_16630, partial [Acidobacteria bacterium]|nr:hypothetical protein [Acidobacteriota bacterium]
MSGNPNDPRNPPPGYRAPPWPPAAAPVAPAAAPPAPAIPAPFAPQPAGAVWAPAAAYPQAPAAYPQAPAPFAQAPAAYPQAPAPFAQAPAAFAPAPAAAGWPAGAVPQPGWAPPQGHAAPAAPAAGPSFVAAALRRAFRLRFAPENVLPSERAALLAAPEPVTDPQAQAYAVWRRSLLFVVAAALVPVTILRMVEVFGSLDGMLSALATFSVLQLVFEAAFAVLAWILLAGWANLGRSRKILVWGWAAYFLFPFVTYLFPFRSLVEEEASGLGVIGKGEVLLVGLLFSLQAIMTLAPKAVSLMPGLLRAAVATKMLFPGAAAPGWLMVLTAPLYGLMVYVVMMVPYQITGSGWFVLALIGLLGAQIWLALTGVGLGRPLDPPEAMRRLARARLGYTIFNAAGLLFVGVGFLVLVDELQLSVLTVANLALSFVANVFILTLVGTDLLILSLRRARDASAGGAAAFDAYGRQLDAFFAGRRA